MLAFNSRLDTIQACVLLAKMPHLEKWTEQRRTIADWYREDLANVDIVLPHAHPEMRHVYHLFVVRTPHRDALISTLASKNIFCGIHYPNPLFTAQPFVKSPTIPYGLPVCSQFANEIVSLPMYPEMTREQVRRVSSAIEEFVVTQERKSALV